MRLEKRSATNSQDLTGQEETIKIRKDLLYLLQSLIVT